MWTHKWVPVEARRGHWIPWSGVASSCELLDLGAENWTQAFCRSSKHSKPLSHLLRPSTSHNIVSESQTSHSRSLSGYAINDQCNILDLNVPSWSICKRRVQWPTVVLGVDGLSRGWGLAGRSWFTGSWRGRQGNSLSPLAPTNWAALFHMGFFLCYSATP